MNYLTLVNKNNLIKERYFNYLELIDCENISNEKIKIEKKTYEAYLLLKFFLEEKGIYIGIDSCYRTVDEQQKIIDLYTREYGLDYVKKYIAPVKMSEHHTGLAIDLSIKVNGGFLIENDDLITYEDIFLEIHKYLKYFGFILSYPKDKENITGYSYEAWHIRYVGIIPAKIIYSNKLTLEEYLTNYSGVLVVNKNMGMTSRDVVNEVSRLLGIKKIGHTGTLDPMAEGVLVLTINKATKIGELLTSYTKEYVAGVETGLLTDTLDTTGKVLKEKKVSKNIDIESVINSFNKTYLQEVPIYSAVKVKGKKLYEYARSNKEVELPKKEVTIKNMKLLDKDDSSFKFKCLVSKGTYIRSLIRDMGLSINEYFSMNSLIRTKQGNFSIDDAYTLEDIKNNNFKILTICDVLSKYPTIVMDDELLKKVSNGVRIEDTFDIDDKVVFKNEMDKIIAIYIKENNYLKIWKMIDC